MWQIQIRKTMVISNATSRYANRSPPYPMSFPNGNPAKPDNESAEFFDAMMEHGYEYILSEEDTGTGRANHKNSYLQLRKKCFGFSFCHC